MSRPVGSLRTELITSGPGCHVASFNGACVVCLLACLFVAVLGMMFILFGISAACKHKGKALAVGRP